MPRWFGREESQNDLKEESAKTLAYPEIIEQNLPLIVSDIADRRFLDSLKGTFVTTEFTEKTKEEVLDKLRDLSK
ncbi:MAG: hypothetical protein NWF00_03770 [Candidatus Bathyarchaeota archaeon]|nr:hypothetical protein [Candidatus Bathyarchaeota archaeon]